MMETRELQSAVCFCHAAKLRMHSFCERDMRRLPQELFDGLQAARDAGVCTLVDQPDPHAAMVKIVKRYKAAHAQAKEWLQRTSAG